MYLQKTFFLFLTLLTRFDAIWALASLISFLHAQTVSMYSVLQSFVFFLFVFEFCQEQLVHPRRPSNIFACFLLIEIGCFWVWRWWPLNINQLSWATVPSRALSYGTLPSKTLKRPKSALLKFGIVILLFTLFPLLRILNSIICLQPSQPQGAPPCQCAWGSTEQLSSLTSLSLESGCCCLCTRGLHMPCSVVLPADIGVFEVSHVY